MMGHLHNEQVFQAKNDKLKKQRSHANRDNAYLLKQAAAVRVETESKLAADAIAASEKESQRTKRKVTLLLQTQV